MAPLVSAEGIIPESVTRKRLSPVAGRSSLIHTSRVVAVKLPQDGAGMIEAGVLVLPARERFVVVVPLVQITVVVPTFVVGSVRKYPAASVGLSLRGCASTGARSSMHNRELKRINVPLKGEDRREVK